LGREFGSGDSSEEAPMRNTIVRLIGILLLTVAIAKIVASRGDAKVLSILDPILGLEFRWSMRIAAAAELFVSAFCLFRTRSASSVVMLLLLSVNLVGYRLWLWAIGWHLPCTCMGGLADAFGISSEVADQMMKGCLGVMLFFSGFCVLIEARAIGRSKGARHLNESYSDAR
jgi:hypothetical protein